MGSVQTYITLLVVGLFLIGLETVVPGGVLGVLGGLVLFAAAVSGFQVFPAPWGLLSAVGIVLLVGMTVAMWVKYFPRTVVGRFLTLSSSTRDYKSAQSLNDMLGKEGIAQTTLRPAGIATISGTRVDVVAEGNWIEHGKAVKVIAVEGNRVTVRETSGS